MEWVEYLSTTMAGRYSRSAVLVALVIKGAVLGSGTVEAVDLRKTKIYFGKWISIHFYIIFFTFFFFWGL